MRGRLVLAGLAVGAAPVFAQFPPPPAPPPAAPLPPAHGLPPAQSRPLPIQIPRLPEPKTPGVHAPGSPGSNTPGSPVTPAGGSIPLPPPQSPGEPRPLPPSIVPGPPLFPQAVPQPDPLAQPRPGLPDQPAPPARPGVVLPYPEQLVPIDPTAVSLRRVATGWQVWAGQRLFRDLGGNETDGREVARVLRELRATEWAAIGSPRPVVEYGLTDGKPPASAGFPKVVVPIDLATVRVEPVKGVWCLRDDDSILFNFGLARADAEQALGVVRKYGFNRVGVVGNPAAPALAYLFATLEAEKTPRPPGGALAAAAQENALTRTGIPVPGVGYVGEMIRIDPRKVEARREGAEWVVAHGPDVLARLGAGEWLAHDAARLIRDARFTEFCTFGSAGVTFFLVNGRAPTRVPLAAQGRRFDPAELKTQPINGRWAVTEAGRHLFDVSGPEEGEQLIRLVRHFQFDQLCQLGASPRASLRFLARGR